MRKITDVDLANIIGMECAGFRIMRVRPKGGSFSDSDCYGIALGCRELDGMFATWQFKLDERYVIPHPKSVDFYWGHYIGDFAAAEQDYSLRTE